MTGTQIQARRDFDSAWRELILQYKPSARVTSALLRLTGVGEHSAKLEQLAESIDRPIHETLALLRQWTTARIQDGQVHLSFTAARPTARYRLQIDTRTLGAHGCAIDVFLDGACGR